MTKIVRSLMLILMLISIPFFATAQVPMPIGVGGKISVDNVPIGGITVHVVNLDTGEAKVTTTSYDTPYTMCGYYTVALTGKNGNIIKAIVTYGGGTYSNTVTVDINQVTQFCDISFSTEDPPDNPPEEPPNDPDNPPEEPPNDPDNPLDNETGENNTDNDISNLYNLTVTVFDDTDNPIDDASVTIYNVNETEITKNYTNTLGKAVFLLEEGNYIIKVTKDNYKLEGGMVNLLCSTEYTISMDKNRAGNPNPNSHQEERTTIFYYWLAGGIVATVVLLGLLYWRVHKSTTHH